jgi:hypothetical protein
MACNPNVNVALEDIVEQFELHAAKARVTLGVGGIVHAPWTPEDWQSRGVLTAAGEPRAASVAGPQQSPRADLPKTKRIIDLVHCAFMNA